MDYNYFCNRYLSDIKELVIYEAKNNIDFKCSYDKMIWFEKLGMVNSMLRDYENIQVPDISRAEINHFYNKTVKLLTAILATCLNELEKQGILQFDDSVYILKGDLNWKASNDEIGYIIQASQASLVYSLFYPDEETHEARMKKMLYREHGWNNFYHCYSVIIDPKYICGEDDINKRIKNINQHVSEDLNTITENEVKGYDI